MSVGTASEFHRTPASTAGYLRAKVAYDGTDFHGFQIQVRRGCSSSVSTRTVQGELERTLSKITGGAEIRVIGAGRTDTGVHALGQVVAFHTEWQHSIEALHRGWNALLARDVTILSLAQAQEGFHPRFSAKSRVYRYTVWNHPIRHPLLRRTAFWVPQPLDVEAMGKATQLLLGTHDFATFGQPPGGYGPSAGTNTMRRVLGAGWTSEENAPDAGVLTFDVEADAFLYRMVRSIVGTLLQVGKNALSVDAFAERFASADRRQAGPTAPANGLCLMTVCY